MSRPKILPRLLLPALFAACLCACGRQDEQTSSVKSGSGTETDISSDTSPEAVGLFLDADGQPWQDNSLDAYSAIARIPLPVETPENEPEGSRVAYFLSDSSAGIFQKHYFEISKDGKKQVDYRDVLKIVTDRGEETSLVLSEHDWGAQTFAACAVPGGGYLAIRLEAHEDDPDNPYRYHFYEIDRNMQAVRDFDAGFPCPDDLDLPRQMLVDHAGNIHLLIASYLEGGERYYIASPDGALLYQSDPISAYNKKLQPLCDGRVALSLDSSLQYVDPSNGTKCMLAEGDFSSYSTLLDEKTLLRATSKGLYKCSLSGDNEELLYLWSNHGITMSEIAMLQVTPDRRISLIYSDSAGANYLVLAPTTEEVEFTSVTLAVSSYHRDTFEPAVTDFNRKYPAFHIDLKEYDYQDNTLLTQMIAGEGPVLIDTSLISFEEYKEYWEPLDEVYSEMGMEDELLTKAMDTGRIDGTLFGIPICFSLKTVVTADTTLADWDYGAFLDRIDDPALETPFNTRSGCYGILLVSQFFIHGLEDNYLLDVESCTTRFDSEEFRRILKTGEKCSEQNTEYGYNDLLDGKMLCFAADIEEPACIPLLRNTLGERLNYIGYPSGNGSKHYIEGKNILAVRASATAREKQIAHTFLKDLLTYDAQLKASGELNFCMSVRKDVLEQQILAVDNHTTGIIFGYGWTIFDEKQLDNERDGKTLHELIDKAQPYRTFPPELMQIINEEVWNYYDNVTDMEMTISHLKNRVELYLKEQ